MAKAQPQKRSPVVYLGVAAAFIAVYLFLNPGDSPKAATKSKSAAAKKKNPNSQYTDDDFKVTAASFKPLKGALVDAFKPLIIRSTGGGGIGNDLGIPGASGWAYSGMVTVDGVKKGVIENASSGENVFLTSGQRWQQYSTGGIYPDHIDLNGPNGSITVSTVAKDSSDTPATAPGMSPPIQIPIQGNIASTDLSVLPDTTANTPRRRRNAN